MIRITKCGHTLAAIFGLVMAWPALIWAQVDTTESYKVDPLDPAFVLPLESDYNLKDRDQKREFTRKKNEVNALRRTVADAAQSAISGQIDLNTGRGDIARYFTGLVFPEMTQTDDESLFKLADRREELFKTLRDTTNTEVRNYLLNETLMPALTRLAEDATYHPAVRLNALLVLGGLNEREGIRGGEPPRPLGTAGQFLIGVASADTQPSLLRIAALTGLVRHATLDGQMFVRTNGASTLLDDAERQAMIDLGCRLIDQVAETDFANISDDTYWMSRQAVQIVGGLARPGDGGKVVVSIRKLLENEQTPPWLLSDAIAAYGGLQFTDAAQADAARISALIGKRLSSMLMSEAKGIDQYIYQSKEKQFLDSKTSATKSEPGASDEPGDVGNSLGGGRGGKQPAGASDAIKKSSTIVFPNYQINEIRQRAKSMTYVCRQALDGAPPRRRNETKAPENIKKFADDATQQSIDRLVKVLDRIMETTNLTNSSSFGGDLSTQGLDQQLKMVLENSSGELDRVVESLTPKLGS